MENVEGKEFVNTSVFSLSDHPAVKNQLTTLRLLFLCKCFFLKVSYIESRNNFPLVTQCRPRPPF